MKNILIYLFLLLCITYLLVAHVSSTGILTEPLASASAPYVMSNTTVEASPNHLEKVTYMEDTCGNFMKSVYDTYIRATLPQPSWGLATPPPVTPDMCLPYQVYSTDPSGNHGSCQNQCSANSNQYFDLTTKTCMYCPIGYTNNGNNQCVPLETCPWGQRYRDQTGICYPCPFGQQYDNNGNCVNICQDYENITLSGQCSLTCPGRTQYWDTHRQSCQTCPPGYLADGHNNCVPAPTCPKGQIHDSNLNCVSECTADGERYNPTTNTCVSICLGNQHFVNNQCVDCPPGQVTDGKNGCIAGPTPLAMDCGIGYAYDSNSHTCKSTCPVGYKNSPYNPALCNPICGGNSVYDPTTGTCQPCPVGQIGDGNNGCKSAPTPTPTPVATVTALTYGNVQVTAVVTTVPPTPNRLYAVIVYVYRVLATTPVST